MPAMGPPGLLQLQPVGEPIGQENSVFDPLGEPGDQYVSQAELDLRTALRQPGQAFGPPAPLAPSPFTPGTPGSPPSIPQAPTLAPPPFQPGIPQTGPQRPAALNAPIASAEMAEALRLAALRGEVVQDPVTGELRETTPEERMAFAIRQQQQAAAAEQEAANVRFQQGVDLEAESSRARQQQMAFDEAARIRAETGQAGAVPLPDRPTPESLNLALSMGQTWDYSLNGGVGGWRRMTPEEQERAHISSLIASTRPNMARSVASGLGLNLADELHQLVTGREMGEGIPQDILRNLTSPLTLVGLAPGALGRGGLTLGRAALGEVGAAALEPVARRGAEEAGLPPILGSLAGGVAGYGLGAAAPSLARAAVRGGIQATAPETGLGRLLREETGAAKIPGGGRPRTVLRVSEVNQPPASLADVAKPQGLYTSPAGVQSPHADLGGPTTTFDVNPSAKVLEVDASELVKTNRGLVGQSAGIAALRQLVGEEEAARLLTSPKLDIVQELTTNFPNVEWSRYFDTQEMLEGYAGLLARQRGFDAIWAVDKTAPEFNEYVGLTTRAFRQPAPATAVPAGPTAVAQGDRVMFEGPTGRQWVETAAGRSAIRGFSDNTTELRGELRDLFDELESVGLAGQRDLLRRDAGELDDVIARWQAWVDTASPEDLRAARDLLGKDASASSFEGLQAKLKVAGKAKTPVAAGAPAPPRPKPLSEAERMQQVLGQPAPATAAPSTPAAVAQGNVPTPAGARRGGGRRPPAGANPPPPPSPPTGGTPPQPPSIPPVQKLTQAIRNAGRVTPEQRAMFAQERARRTARGAAVLERGQGPDAFRAARGALKGEFARPDFAVPAITPEDTTQLLETIRTADHLQFYDKVVAEQALQDLFSGRIPQPAQLAALQKAFSVEGEALVKAVLDKRGLGEKAWDEVVGLLGLPQALKASFDISAPFRQGQMLGWSNPRDWAKAWKPMLKAFGSDEGLKASAQYIDNSPWIKTTGDKAGYGFKDVGGKIYEPNALADALERPGGFAGLNQSHISRAAQRIPGVNSSQRAYATFLNEQGLRVYEKTAQAMWDAGVRDIAQYEAVAKVINHARGYGDFSVGQLAKGVNAFFSGRNFVARFQVLLDPFTQPGSLLEPSARQLAAKNLAGMITGDMTTVGLLGAMGAATGMWSVEMDPRSTDWGKIRIGDSRYDIWAGFSPMVRLAARIATGDLKSAAGDIYPVSAKDEVLKFLRNKQAPAAALIVDLLVGQNAIGETTKVNLPRVADMFVPFIAGDVVEALLGERTFSSIATPGALAGIPLGAVGVGTLNYPPSSSELLNRELKKVPAAERTDIEGKVRNSWRELSNAQQNAIAAKYPEIAKILEGQQAESDSPFTEITKKLEEQRVKAFTEFQQSGDGESYRRALSDASFEASIRYDQEGKGQDPETYSPDQKLMQAYFREVADVAGDDYELRDRLDAQFRANLSPEALAALEANLLTSADPNYAKLKAARDYLEGAYWQQYDQAFIEIRDAAVTNLPNSPVANYATYDDLAKAAASRSNPDPVAQKVKSAVDSHLNKMTAVVRLNDPKADALLYIYGYRDSVISAQAQAMVVAWAKENGVTLAPPPIKVSR